MKNIMGFTVSVLCCVLGIYVCYQAYGAGFISLSSAAGQQRLLPPDFLHFFLIVGVATMVASQTIMFLCGRSFSTFIDVVVMAGGVVLLARLSDKSYFQKVLTPDAVATGVSWSTCSWAQKITAFTPGLFIFWAGFSVILITVLEIWGGRDWIAQRFYGRKRQI